MSRMAEQQLYIHGGYTSATSGRTFETINPANGNVLATVQAAGREDVDRAVKSAQQGQKIWAAMTAMERSRILRIYMVVIPPPPAVAPSRPLTRPTVTCWRPCRPPGVRMSIAP